ncbi:MAG UNVERIFIED_CONTAM: DUF1549 domain-containing protein [Planctomycetaceae bacterium]
MQTLTAFCSTTVGCARCHDHKFDPVTQADYYSMQAVFAGIGKGDIPFDADPAVSAARLPLAGAQSCSGSKGRRAADV